MIVDRIALLSDLKACLLGADKGANASIEGFDTFWFDGSYVHSFNRIIATSIPCSALGIDCAIKAQEFVKLLSRYKAPTIEIEQGEGVLNWKCGRGSGTITMLDATIRDRIQGLKLDECVFEDVPEGLIDGIRLCFIPKNPSPYKSVCISKDNVFSTDGIRLNVFKMTTPLSKGVFLDEPAVKTLISLPDPIQICVNDLWCHFRYDNGMIFSAVVKRFADFPESIFHKWISASSKKDSDVCGKIPDSIAEVAERVSIFSDTTTGRCPITLTMKEREIVLHASKEGGEISEAVSWDEVLSEDPNIVVVIDAPFLAQIAKKAPKFYITSISNKPVAVFHSEGYMQIVNLTPPKVMR